MMPQGKPKKGLLLIADDKAPDLTSPEHEDKAPEPQQEGDSESVEVQYLGAILDELREIKDLLGQRQGGEPMQHQGGPPQGMMTPKA